MFKQIITVIILLFLVQLSSYSKDITVDEIIASVIKSRGGNEAADAIKTMKITGKMSAMGMDLPMSIQFKNPGKNRTDMEVMGSKIVEVVNGNEGWFINPLMGNSNPTKMPEAEFNENKDKNDFVNFSLAKYKENGLKVTLQGTKIIDGKECYKLFVVTKDAKESYTYIDISDFKIIMQSSKGNVMGKMAELEIYFKDYKSENGLLMSHTMDTKSDGQSIGTIIFDKIEINIDIPDSIFELPK